MTTKHGDHKMLPAVLDFNTKVINAPEMFAAGDRRSILPLTSQSVKKGHTNSTSCIMSATPLNVAL